MQRRVAALLAAVLMAAACTGEGEPLDPGPTPTATGAADLTAPTGAVSVGVATAAGVVVDGAPLGAAPLRVPTGQVIDWVVGAPLADGRVLWVVVSDVDTALGVVVDADGEATQVDLGRWDSARPPTLVVGDDGTWELVDPTGVGGAASVLVLGDGTVVAVTTDGGLRIGDDELPGPYLPDAHPVVVDEGRVAVLAGPTDVYGHGVIGDALEASALHVVDVARREVTTVLEPEAGRVIEGVTVRVGDVDGDGGGDVVVTTSGAGDGARVEAWQVDGDQRWIGEALGQDGRWRHVVALTGGASTGAAGDRVIEVVMPHARHDVAALVADGDRLVEVATGTLAFGSHAIGSRDMEGAAVAPLLTARDVVGPSPRRGMVVARSWDGTAFGDEVVLVDAAPTSNMAAVVADGIRALAVGEAAQHADQGAHQQGEADRIEPPRWLAVLAPG